MWHKIVEEAPMATYLKTQGLMHFASNSSNLLSEARECPPGPFYGIFETTPAMLVAQFIAFASSSFVRTVSIISHQHWE